METYVNSGTLTPSKGGIVTTSDQKASVTIPPGALSQDTTVTIGLASEQDAGALGPTYVLGPPELTFNEPVEITLPYDPSAVPHDADEYDVSIYRTDTFDSVTVLPTLLDPAAGMARATTTKFSPFQVRHMIPELKWQVVQFEGPVHGDCGKGPTWSLSGAMCELCCESGHPQLSAEAPAGQYGEGYIVSGSWSRTFHLPITAEDERWRVVVSSSLHVKDLSGLSVSYHYFPKTNKDFWVCGAIWLMMVLGSSSYCDVGAASHKTQLMETYVTEWNPNPNQTVSIEVGLEGRGMVPLDQSTILYDAVGAIEAWINYIHFHRQRKSNAF